MRVILTALCLSFLFVNAQEGVQFGFKIGGGYKLNTHRNKATTLRSADNGYGFTFGVPVKKWLDDYSSIDFGLEYEYTAFDQYAAGQLQSSRRIQAIGIPFMYSSNLFGDWYWQAGGGLNYHVLVQSWVLGFKTNDNALAKRIQPYVGLGASYLMDRGDHLFEFGLQSRFFPIDLWKEETTFFQVATSKLLIFDFVLKFYL